MKNLEKKKHSKLTMKLHSKGKTQPPKHLSNLLKGATGYTSSKED
jgi:hypothetical protein